MTKYRDIEKLRADIRRMRSNSATWDEICRELDILTVDGRPNPKLAQDIGFKSVNFHGEAMPYEPHDPDVRHRLGLRPVCASCGRPPPRHRDAPQKRVPYKHLLVNVAMPALADIWHANDMTGSGRRGRAKFAYETIMSVLNPKEQK